MMTLPGPLRIAMWSGPRNISTAMMRSWGNRDDTVVVDEPLYACYLEATGKPHPGADEIIAAGETDWRKVVRQLTENRPLTPSGPEATSDERDASRSQMAELSSDSVPHGVRGLLSGRRIYYQKHMTHHLL